MSISFPVISGVGIHSGQWYELSASLRTPSTSDKGGVVFYCQSAEFPKIHLETPAHFSRLSGTSRSTALVVRGPQKLKSELKTIEHLMAACHVEGFPDFNFFIREKNPEKNKESMFEIPILKGSAQGFEGLFENLNSKPYLEAFRITRPFVFEIEGKKIEFLPFSKESEFSNFSVFEVQVDFGAKLKQEFSWSLDWLSPSAGRQSFWNSIAGARTFGFTHEIENLKKRGLGQGANLENAILLDGSEVVNPEGFKFENELAAHKLLDALGDFALIGGPILGRVRCQRAGHAVHLRALSEAFKAEIFEKTVIEKTQTVKSVIGA